MNACGPPPHWLPVERLLALHAAREPQRTAVVDVDRDVHLSFGELPALVDGVALQLRDLGVRRGSRVVLIIDGPIETLVAWLALWRLAAVVCPFDISQVGAHTTQAAFNTLQPELLLHGQRIGVVDIPASAVPCVRFSQWPPVPWQAAAVTLTPTSATSALADLGAQAGDVAAACCTSGSSGHLKIVLHDHASYWLNGLASQTLLGLHEDDRMLEYRSLSWYSPQILTLMPFLQCGFSLHMARQFSATRLPDWLARYGISVVAGVPTVLNILLAQPAERLRESTAGLRVMSSSSAPLAAHTWARFEHETGITVLNLYGSSEGGWICGNRLGDRRMGTVGRPAPGIELRIVDAEGRECAVGEPGEVVIEGGKLALGTLQADGQLNPIRGAPFATRDLGVRDVEGFVHLLGRMDDLVIRGGVKISPSEIEDALLTHADVAEAAAVGVPDPIYGQQAVAFVVLRAGAGVDAAELQAHVANQLAREKCPLAVCPIEALPRNARGKLRRDALQARWHDMDGERSHT